MQVPFSFELMAYVFSICAITLTVTCVLYASHRASVENESLELEKAQLAAQQNDNEPIGHRTIESTLMRNLNNTLRPTYVPDRFVLAGEAAEAAKKRR